MSTPIVVRRAPMSNQHSVETDAGAAVITRMDGTGPKGGRILGEDYEIETNFTGDRVRLHYGYASFAVAKRGVQRLADTHLAEVAKRAVTVPRNPFPRKGRAW